MSLEAIAEEEMRLYATKHNLEFDYRPETIQQIVSDQRFDRTKHRLLGVTLRDLQAESQATRNFVSKK